MREIETAPGVLAPLPEAVLARERAQAAGWAEEAGNGGVRDFAERVRRLLELQGIRGPITGHAVGYGLTGLSGPLHAATHLSMDWATGEDEIARGPAAWLRIARTSPAAMRHEGDDADVGLVMAAGLDTGAAIAALFPLVRDDGGIVAAIPLTDFIEADLGVLWPPPNRTDHDAPRLALAQGFRTAGAAGGGVDPTGALVVLRATVRRGGAERTESEARAAAMSADVFRAAADFAGGDSAEMVDSAALARRLGWDHVPAAWREILSAHDHELARMDRAAESAAGLAKRTTMLVDAAAGLFRDDRNPAALPVEETRAWLRDVSLMSLAQEAPLDWLPELWRGDVTLRGRLQRGLSAERDRRGEDLPYVWPPGNPLGWNGSPRSTIVVPMPQPNDARREYLFAGPVPAENVAQAAAVRSGTVADPEVRRAMEPGSRAVARSLETPRTEQLAQMMAVQPAAVAARVECAMHRRIFPLRGCGGCEDGAHAVHVALHVIHEYRSERGAGEGADADGQRWATVIESESMEIAATVLDEGDAGIARIVPGTGEDAAGGRDLIQDLQLLLAPRLLEALRDSLDVLLPAEDFAAERDAMEAAAADGPALGVELWGQQERAAVAGAWSLGRDGAWVLSGEAGSGKTIVLCAAARLLRVRRVVVVCPANVVEEWREGVAKALPEVRFVVVRRPAELRAAAAGTEIAGGTTVIAVPDAALSAGHARRRAAVVRRVQVEPRMRGRPDAPASVERACCADCGAPVRNDEAGGQRWLRARGGAVAPRCRADVERGGVTRPCGAALFTVAPRQESGYEPAGGEGVPSGRGRYVPTRVFACGTCGWHRLSAGGQPLSERKASGGSCELCGACGRCGTRGCEPKRCAEAGEPADAGAVIVALVDRREGDLARAAVRHGIEIPLLILDEAHRFKDATAGRAVAAGRLIETAERSALATGTIMDGRPSSAYHLLCRMLPGLRKRFDSQRAFVAEFGVMLVSSRLRQDGDGVEKTRTQVTEEPGTHPALIMELLPWFTGLTLEEAAGREIDRSEYLVRPPIEAEPVPVASPGSAAFEAFMSEVFLPERERQLATAGAATGDVARERAQAWDEVEQALMDGDVDQRLIGDDSPARRGERLRDIVIEHSRLNTSIADRPAWRFWASTWNWRGEVLVADRKPVGVLLPASGQLSAKERALRDIVRAERAAGRACLIFMEGMHARDVAGRVHDVLTEAGVHARVVRSGSVPSAEHKKWIAARVREGVEALVAHPDGVGTGMNLQAFPTVIVYEINHSSYTMRQAVMRSTRADQERPVRVVWLVSGGTVQDDDLIKTASHSLAAGVLEGRGGDGLLEALGETRLHAQSLGFRMLRQQERAGAGDAQAVRDVTERAARLAAAEERFAYSPLATNTAPARSVPARSRGTQGDFGW